jgi:hypothetical protein
LKRLLLAAAAAAVLLAGCGTSAAMRLGQAAHMTIYLPQKLPAGMQYAGGRSIGKQMLYLRYTAARKALVLFESPNPIAAPPGASEQGSGIWVAVSVVNGQTVRSLLLRRPHAYVEAVATGLTSADLEIVQNSLQEYVP